VVVTHDDDREVFEDDDCEVALEDGQILVTYWDERGPVVLQGKQQGDVFEVVARSRPSNATLTRRGDIFEGRWEELGDTGGLRIELSEPEESKGENS
jgi:hypothetical protein